jgi:hypothetical protein
MWPIKDKTARKRRGLVRKHLVIIGLSVETRLPDQLTLATDTSGYALVEGNRVRSLSHLPGDIAVIEFDEGMVLIPWSLFNHLMSQAARRYAPQ